MTAIMNNSLEAIYYPDCYPRDLNVFASMYLYFDRIHFISPSDSASTAESYTLYLKNLPSTGVGIGVIGDHTSPAAKRNMTRFGGFIKFALDIKPLLSESVFYHPNLLSGSINNIVSKLLSGNLPAEEFLSFVDGVTPELSTLKEFYRDNPHLDDEFLRRVLPAARLLATKSNWIAISDEASLPVPILHSFNRSAADLSSAIALELISLHLPNASWTNAEDLMHLRQILSGDLVPFRMMVLKLAGRLRGLLSEGADYGRVRDEAKFLAQTEVLPFIAEVQRRISLEKGMLWRNIFGTAIKWLSLGLSSFSDPTGSAILKAIEEAGRDTASLLGSAHSVTAAGDPGLSFLIKLQTTAELSKKQ